MTIAHVAGVPFEEWLSPLIVSGGGILITARLALRRRSLSPTHRPRRAVTLKSGAARVGRAERRKLSSVTDHTSRRHPIVGRSGTGPPAA